MDLIISSLTLQPNLFQLFQPIGGVSATPLSHARAVGIKLEAKIIMASNLYLTRTSLCFTPEIIQDLLLGEGGGYKCKQRNFSAGEESGLRPSETTQRKLQ